MLRAAQVVLEEGIAKPILIGRRDVDRGAPQALRPDDPAGRRFRADQSRGRSALPRLCRDLPAKWRGARRDAGRRAHVVRTNTTVIARARGRARRRRRDDLRPRGPLPVAPRHIRDIIGLAPGVTRFVGAVAHHHLERRLLPHRHPCAVDPTAEEIAEMAIACAHHVRRFGIEPKIALLSHSDFGSRDTPSALKMRDGPAPVAERAPDLEVDGEMQADSALSQDAPPARHPELAPARARPTCWSSRTSTPPTSPLQLTKMMPTRCLSARSCSARPSPAHILTPSVTSRGVVNMTALAAVEAASD